MAGYYVKSAVISLQGPSSDLISSMSKVEECFKDLKQEREDIEHCSQLILLLVDKHTTRVAPLPLSPSILSISPMLMLLMKSFIVGSQNG